MPLNNPTPTEQLTALREGILAKFNLEELRTLVFDLNVNYDDLRGDTISAKIQALVEHLEKRDRISDLLTLLKQRRPNEKWDSFVPSQPDAQSPYKGLQFFTAADADLFFGREQLTAELIDHLRAHRFLAVVGASGSGKSSVVRAGVIPRIKSGALAEDGLSSDTWQVHIITPTEHPLQNLANSLTRDSESVTAAITLADDLQQDSRSLDLYVSRQLAGESHGHILLVVDQFEELFTQCDDLEESRLFVENLVTAVTSGMPGRLRLILTLRADFYAYAVQHESLRPLLETRQKIVGAMNQAELRQAIDSPAQATGWRLQPGLIDTILQAVGREPGALPLLSHALQETWERREGRVMTLAGYQAAGGVRQAIAQTADTVYSQLTPKEQSIARNIFLRLTELGEGREDTRRRAALTELLPQDEKETAVRDVLYLLTQKRLVTLNEERTEENTSQNYAEVAHEALIREWPTLRKWLDENREGLRIHRQLTAVVKEWQAAEEDPSYLYQGIRLARAMDWAAEHTNNLNLLESRFLQTSKEREVNEQARIAAIATERTRASRFLNIALLVANIFAIAFLIILLQNRANLATAVAQAQTLQSQALAASAQSVRGNNDMQALLLAIASAQTADTAMALETLNHQLSLMTKPVQTYVHGSSVGGARWNRDESHLLSWSGDGVVQVWKRGDSAPLLVLNHIDQVRGATWNENETLIMSWSDGGLVRIWAAETGALLVTMAHESSVIGVRWNNDESRLLSWSLDGTARVWDAASGEPLLTLTHNGGVSGAVWNKDERLILTWSGDETAKVWDARTGARLMSLTHTSKVNGAIWNSDETRILSWSGDGTVWVFDAATGAESFTLPHAYEVSGAVWNKDENRILTWGYDAAVRIWDADTGLPLLTMNQNGWVFGAVLNKDETRILSWGYDGTAKVWDALEGNLLLLLPHELAVEGASWNDDESQILSWSGDGMARVWDAQTGSLLSKLPHESRVIGALWDNEEANILTWSSDGTAREWMTGGGNRLWQPTPDGGPTQAIWNREDNQILTWSWNGSVHVWDARTGLLLLTLSHEKSVGGAAWSPDETRILTWSIDGNARVWNATTGALLLTLTHDDMVSRAVWNRNGSRILSWGPDQKIYIWDATTGALFISLTYEGIIGKAEWNDDESLILTLDYFNKAQIWDAQDGSLYFSFADEQSGGSQLNREKNQILNWRNDGVVQIWDIKTRESVWSVNTGGSPEGATWNQNETKIMAWNTDGIVQVWDIETGGLLQTLSFGNQVKGAVLNSDEDQILIWGESSVQIWNTNTGNLVLTLYHEEWVSAAGWDQDEKHVLTLSGNEKKGVVWDAVTGELILSLANGNDGITSALWNHAGNQILVTTSDGVNHLYYTDISELIDLACQYTIRNFTWQEWQVYFPGQAYRVTCDQWPMHPSVPLEKNP